MCFHSRTMGIQPHPCGCPISRETEKTDHLVSAHRCIPCGQVVPDMEAHKAKRHFCWFCQCSHQEPPCDHYEQHHKCTSCDKYYASLEEHDELCHCCKHCNHYFPESSELDVHNEKTHFCRKCESNVRNLRSHMRTHCPYCEYSNQNFQDLYNHMILDHRLQPCKDCPLFGGSSLYKELLEHTEHRHPSIACPLCPDKRAIHTTSIRDHLRAIHYFEECSDCMDPTAQYAQDHFRNYHGKQSCEECSESMYPAPLEEHLIDDHGHVRCPYCKGINAQASHEGHMECHRPRSCPDPNCSELVPADDMPHHGRVEHSWPTCPSCYHTMPDDQLQYHLATAHPECEGCGKPYDAFAINTHRSAAHGWDDCDHCGIQCSPSSIALHRSDHRPINCPYPNCNTKCPLVEWVSHFRSVHSSNTCPTCGKEFNEGDSVAHFFSHYGQSGPQEHLDELIEIKVSSFYWSNDGKPLTRSASTFVSDKQILRRTNPTSEVAS